MAENYTAEDFFDAIGQELTCFSHYLYVIEPDSDSYLLIIIPIEKETEFKKFLKSNKLIGMMRKQARRKEGVNAKRIDLGKRLPVSKITLKENYCINLVEDYINGNVLLDYSNYRKRRFVSAILNISEWPPIQKSDKEMLIRRLEISDNGIYVVSAQRNSVNEDGYLSDNNTRILIGKDIEEIEQWQCVYEKEDIKWSAFKWFKDGLFVADNNNVYYIKDVYDFEKSMEKVLEFKKR